jgi:hypothetical protein
MHGLYNRNKKTKGTREKKVTGRLSDLIHLKKGKSNDYIFEKKCASRYKKVQNAVMQKKYKQILSNESSSREGTKKYIINASKSHLRINLFTVNNVEKSYICILVRVF